MAAVVVPQLMQWRIGSKGLCEPAFSVFLRVLMRLPPVSCVFVPQDLD